MGTRIPPPCPSSFPKLYEQPSLAGLPQLIDDLQRLLDDQDNTDVVFLCGKEDEERRINAHRIILIARCKSFKTAKRSEICRIPGCSVSSGSPTQIRLPHVNPEVFRQFILYVYTAKIVLQDSRVFEMMTLAQDMGVEELRAACEDHVIATLSVDNACTFLSAVMDIHERAGATCAASFMERCITYIGENASECIKTNSFLNLNKEGVIKLISSDYFCLEEEDVWRAVLAWAKNHAGVTQPTVHWTDEERVRVCQYLSGVMSHVRLLLIDSKVFAEEVEPTGAVPIELSLERYRHAALHSNKIPAGSKSTSTLPLVNLNKDDKRLQPRLTVNMFPGSQILKADKLYLQSILNGWYGVSKQLWRLIFRASLHGFSSSAFHHYCDGVAPCFVIGIGSRGEISGGFTDVAWINTNRKGGYIQSDRAFLYSLNTNDSPAKFEITKKPYAICYHPDCGPIFGAGADLLIANNCNANFDSYSNLPHSYDGINASYMTLFGEYNFMITDYEVYTLAAVVNNSTPSLNSNCTNNKNIQSSSSVIENNGTAMATGASLISSANAPNGSTTNLNKKYEKY